MKRSGPKSLPTRKRGTGDRSGENSPVYGFWGFVFLYAVILAYAVATGNTELIAQTPMILGSFAALMVLPASILGVASYHRGVEKRILAGEKRIPGPGFNLFQRNQQTA